MAAMATPVCRNGCFILPPQLSPYPGHLQSFVFPWPPEKKSHCRLGFHSKISPALASISGTTTPHFSSHTHDRRRSATASAQTVLVDREEEKVTLPGLPSLPYSANSSLSVESWGSFYTGPYESKYWNSNRHFPYTVGYTSIKSYKGKQYLQKIEEGPDGPLFVVDVIGESKSFSSKSPQKVWNDVVEEDGQNVQGARHFGFQSPDVIKALQELPRLQKRSRKEEAFSAREPEVYNNSLSSIGEGQVSDTIQSDRDHESAQVEVLFEEDSEDDLGDEEMVEEDDEDDGEVAAAAEVHEEEEEEEDGVIEDDVLHDDHDVDDSHDHDLETDDDDDDEDDNERDPLSYNVYSSKRRVHADDDSPTFDDTGPLLNNFKQSFRSTHTGSSFDRFDSADEPYKEDIGVPSNDVYYPSEHGRSKVVGRVWRKGDSLAGHSSVGYGKQHGTERPAGEQRSLSHEGAQPRASAALSFNGSKSWDGPFTRKREENTKSSQMLLDLLQKWNKAKRWNREPGATVRGRVESKNLQSREDNEQQQDVSWGDERAFMSSSRRVSETNSSALKGNLNLRSYEGQEPIQSSPFSSESNEFVSDELSDVDESTDYAISKLFETVGKRETLRSGVQSPPSLGKLLVDSSRMVNHVEKSWSSGAISRPNGTVGYQQTRSELGDVAKQAREVDREGSQALNLADKRVNNADISAAEKMKDLGSESIQLIGRGVPTLAKKQAEEVRLIESVRKLVGSERYEDALLAVKSAKASNLDLQVDVYEALLGDVKLEAWQKQVFTHVEDGNSVLVSAPSGAGKSTVAECCLFRNFIEENRTLFVTPSENLAKEKLNMLGSIFGHRNVGGTRTRMQKDHKVVVLTLEMLAKMLQELNGPGGSEFRFFFEGVNMVVLDKLHTFSEAKYGTMWEEVFMLMDARIKVLALTLPANNEDQIVSWIGMNRGPCELVSSRVEPVLKRYFFCHGSGFFPLLDAKGVQLNDVLLESTGGYKNSMTKEQLESFFLSGYDKPSLKQALSLLADNAMLPAFVAFFNIKGCNDAMQDVFGALGEGLLSKQELAKLEAHWNELGETHPDLLKHLEQADREALRKGFAACHEGKLPAWQTFVLKLFQENILKLLIVTENILFHTEVVARTIILPATCKVMKDGVLPIRSVQALPLFGSAGRRGYDIEGNVVFLKNFYSGPSEAASLVLKNDLDIVSSFKPSYSLVLNLMAKYKLSKVKQLLGSTLHDVIYYNTHAKDKKLEEVDRKILDCLESKADFEVKLFQGLADVNKQKLADAAVFTRVDIRMTIHSASHNGNAFPGFLLAVVPDQAEPFYMVFGADNNFRLVPAGALDHVYTVESPPLDVLYKQLTGQPLQPPAIPPKESWTVEHDGTGGYICRGDSQTRQYVKLLMDYPVQLNVVKEGLQLRKEILLLDTQISNLIEKRRSLHTGKQFGETQLAGSTEVVNGGALELDDSDTWKEAMRLLKILEQVDALSLTESQGAHVKLKPLGMLISRLHNVDNELWLALVLTLSHVKQLPPGEFMAIVAATVPLETEVENLFNDQRDLLYRATRPLKEAFTMLEVLRKQVAALQGSYTPPLQFCTTFAGMVYAWARGKPGTVGFNLENTNDGEVAWKLKSVVRYANLISRACSQVSVDISEPNDFSSLSMLARKAEESLSRHLVAVDRSI
eukprot:c21406_g1_i1 orf=175-5178(+)